MIQDQDSAPDKVYIWEPSPGHGLESFLINDPSPDALDPLGSYIPSPGHTGWDLEGAYMIVWAVGIGIFDPCKKGGLVQALGQGTVCPTLNKSTESTGHVIKMRD